MTEEVDRGYQGQMNERSLLGVLSGGMLCLIEMKRKSGNSENLWYHIHILHEAENDVGCSCLLLVNESSLYVKWGSGGVAAGMATGGRFKLK